MSEVKKQRVLVFIVQYPNFSETYMHEELRNLAENYDVHIITYKKSPFPRKETFNYTLIEYDLPCFVYYPFDQVDWSMTKHESVKFLAAIEEVIREFKPDILHAHYFGLTILLQHLAEIHKLPFTVRTHSMDVLREPAAKLEKLCALSNSAWSAGVLALPCFRQRLLDHGLAESKLVDCWPLINFERFYKPEKRAKSGKIICAGPSSPKKAHKDFVDLALKMKEAGSDLVFDLYTDGYTLQTTVDYNQSRGNPVGITYVDPDEMPQIYPQYDWLVYTADPKINRVGFPVGMVEAQASGLGILWQELPGRRQEQLSNLQGAGLLYKSIDEIPAIISQPYPEEMRQKGFERAKLCSAKDQSHLLTDLWDAFAKQRDAIEHPQDLVSIIISYYEKPCDLCQSVTSALDQSYSNVEVIVVDDASREYPAATILDESLLARIRLITHETNRGVSAARNTAVKASAGRFIVPLDADDLLHKDFVLRCTQAAVAGSLDAVYTQMQWFGDSEYLMTPKANLINLLCHKEGFPTFLYSREVFDKIGGYREDMPVGSDHQFLLSVAANNFALARIDGPLWCYRKSNSGLAAIDVEKRMANLIESNRSLFELHWPEVIARIDSYYLALFEEYHRAIKESTEQNISLSQELDRYRTIYEEYLKVLAGYERLVDECTRLGHENNLQRQLFESLKKKIELSLSAPDAVQFADKFKSNARDFKIQVKRSKKANKLEIEAIQNSSIFDENYYKRQCRQKGVSISDPIEHFLEHGWKISLNPSPLFDVCFYQKQLRQRRIEWSGNPLIHFLQQGAAMGIATSELFDTHWYLSHYFDVAESGLNPLSHFVHFGSLEGRHSVEPGAWQYSDLQTNHGAVMIGSKAGKTGSTERSDVLSRDGSIYDLIIGLHEASRTGAPLVGQAIARALKKRGLNPLLFLLKGGPLLKELSEEFDVVDLSAQFDPQSFLNSQLTDLENSGRLASSTVILNSAEMHPFHRPLKQRGMKVISLIHEFLSLYSHHTRENLRKNTDLPIFSCRPILNEALSISNGPWHNYEILSQGLIDSEFGQRIQRTEARKALASAAGVVDGDFVVLACGTAETRKGIDLFVQVARSVLAQAPRARFVWIGGTHTAGLDPLAWAIKDAELSGIQDRVHFLDSMENIEPLFTGADLFVLPSRLDPLPCVLHQAMACRLPVVAFSGSGGVEEILRDGGGHLVPFLDVAAMAQSILHFIENPTTLSQEGAKAVQVVSQRYNFEEYINQLIEKTKIEKRESTTTDKRTPVTTA